MQIYLGLGSHFGISYIIYDELFFVCDNCLNNERLQIINLL
jgi:hypothetical protein